MRRIDNDGAGGLGWSDNRRAGAETAAAIPSARALLGLIIRRQRGDHAGIGPGSRSCRDRSRHRTRHIRAARPTADISRRTKARRWLRREAAVRPVSRLTIGLARRRRRIGFGLLLAGIGLRRIRLAISAVGGARRRRCAGAGRRQRRAVISLRSVARGRWRGIRLITGSWLRIVLSGGRADHCGEGEGKQCQAGADAHGNSPKVPKDIALLCEPDWAGTRQPCCKARGIRSILAVSRCLPRLA